MEHQRRISAGPMAQSSMHTARKSFAITHTVVNKPHLEKEIVSVHTSTPLLEQRIRHEDANQTYQGEINLLSIVDTNKEIMCCKYTEDTNEVAAGFTDGIIRLFDCKTGGCTHTLVDDECRSYPGPVTAIKHRPVSKAHPITNLLLSSYVNGCIKCWKYKYDQCLYTIREKRQTLGLNYHPRFTKFISYGDDARLNMYDEEAQTQERTFYSSQRKNFIDGHTSRIFACAFNPKSHHELISGGWDNSVICWDDRQPFATRHFVGVHICGEGLDFDKPGKQILTCSWQDKNSIQIWDYGSCKLIDTVVPDNHSSKLYCGKLVPSTNLMVCGGSDSNILRVVDVNLKLTECSIRNNPGAIYAFDFGTVRRKPRKVPDTYRRTSELQHVPRVSFVTGKRLQTVDFG
ncbi:uncharacterized protein LOC126367914 [Pectinophora gossypiella]|uniref:uncharacterized protein LOC126367914 n=1 Tax=Pectinophora gossypiella TaxID=13191 RepID=UPI00214E0BAA|nr:uncharacterized protein LOC126367914 [Pectinophora gossypiella]